MIQKKAIVYAPFLLVLLNFSFKIIFLDSNSVAGDEPFSIYMAQMDVPSVIRHLSTGNNPPFYEIFLHFWIRIFGISAFSVRFPSLLFSAFTVYYIFMTGRKFLNDPAAITAGLLFSFSNYHLSFSHEARVYSLFGLLTCASMYYFLCIFKENGKHEKGERKNSIRYSLLLAINVILIYSHYFGFFVIIIQSISILLKKKETKVFKSYVLYLIILFILYLPNIPVLALRFLHSAVHGTWLSEPDGIESIYDMFWKFSNRPVPAVFCIATLILAAVKATIYRHFQYISWNKKVIWMWFILPFFCMFIISYWIPMFLDRYLMFISPAYLLCLSLAAVHLFEKKKYTYFLPGLLIFSFVFSFNPNTDNGRHARDAIEKFRKLKTENTVAYFCPDWFDLNFVYYYNPDYFRNFNNRDIKKNIHRSLRLENIFPIGNSSQIDTNLISRADKIIYLDDAGEFHYPGNGIKKYLISLNREWSEYKFPETFSLFEFKRKK